MNIDELETKYLTPNQQEEASQSEKEHLIVRLMTQATEND